MLSTVRYRDPTALQSHPRFHAGLSIYLEGGNSNVDAQKETIIIVHGTWAAPEPDKCKWYEPPNKLPSRLIPLTCDCCRRLIRGAWQHFVGEREVVGRHDQRDHHLGAVAALVATVAVTAGVILVVRLRGLKIGAGQIIPSNLLSLFSAETAPRR